MTTKTTIIAPTHSAGVGFARIDLGLRLEEVDIITPETAYKLRGRTDLTDFRVVYPAHGGENSAFFSLLCDANAIADNNILRQRLHESETR